MKIRSSHVTAALLAAIGGFIAFAIFYTPSGDRPEAARVDDVDDAFLREVRARAAETRPGEVAAGSLPGTDDDPDRVARIEVETAEYDIGTVPNTGLTKGGFTITNRGRAPLRINDIRTTCPCTVGQVPRGQEIVPPNGSVEVEVTIDPRRIAGFYSKKTLTIFSNDPAHPVVAVDVVARVDPEFEVVPEIVDFGAVAKGDPATRTVLLRQAGEAPVTLRSVESLGGGAAGGGDLTYDFARVPEADWAAPGMAEYRIDISLNPEIPPGEFRRFVNIETNVRRLPTYRIEVIGEVRSEYAMTPRYPQRLMLRDDDGPYAGVATVSADAPIAIENLRYDNEKLEVGIVEGGEHSLNIEVRAAPTAPRGRLEEEVSFTLMTGGGVYEERLLVRAFLRDEPLS